MTLIFTPRHVTDPDVLAVAGRVTILRELDDTEADPEVGHMFRVRNLDNGRTTSVFADELDAPRG